MTEKVVRSKGMYVLESTNKNAPTQFGYDILRDTVLPLLLGKHEDDILYWAGKEVARKFPIFSLEELPTFFQEAGWGLLTLEKESKDEAIYHLTHSALSELNGGSCQLEAGFIAEQYQKLNRCLTECFGEKIQKQAYIRFTVRWDIKTKIE